MPTREGEGLVDEAEAMTQRADIANSTPAVTPFWIGGRRLASSGARFGDVYNPATGAVMHQVAFANAADIDAAVHAAQAAFPAWRDTPPLRRARVLQEFLALTRQHQRELAQLASAEHGKTLADAMGSVQRGIEVIEFACGIPQLLKGEHAENVGTGVDCHTRLQPLGVCVGITPFNFPAMVPLWMFPVAIACGNTFVLKPSEKVPSCSMRMAELFQQAGLPDGVFNVVHGEKETVDALLQHAQVKAVSFVGSTPIARYIYETCAKQGKRVQALGGAKNHAVVLPDANLDFAADALVGAGYGSAGERCMAISVVVAVGDIADALVATLRDKASKIEIGPSDRDGVEMGPLVTRAHRDKVSGYIDKGIAEGAVPVLDGRGKTVTGFEQGFFLGATLFDHVTPDMTIYKDEIFGPVLSVVRVESLEQAIALVNRCPYANGTAIFTASGGAARKFEHEIEIGMVGVNVPIPVPMAFFSFGGWRGSLFGDHALHGMDGVRFYTRPKVITTRWTGTGPGPRLHMPTLE
jgi:malonate-semialdehyde dehydrogenase (acetylating)/methylmalonate-semialdehyde dehydrogenase